MADVTVFRFFAAARAATGMREATSDGATLGEALEDIAAQIDPGRRERWTELAPRCSFLVDGVTTRDLSTVLAGAALVDVMPPFAGG